ncbi:MAG: hypothetical protein KDB03_27435, partial [Planctomycetales bacterium]|nr:hypothetical protein [Planctomycetales bacterium]
SSTRPIWFDSLAVFSQFHPFNPIGQKPGIQTGSKRMIATIFNFVNAPKAIAAQNLCQTQE